ncbi:MAG: hypothetical protein HS108_09390 [Planctomycetes bacterium]|jgi:hypothetical protein|nr:hypothetical protein [Planctomycetota bacterium]MCL4729793.1 hypothetical protein [Planctomycetota bacterium]
MRNNGQSCNDCGLPGEPVPGQEDVYAWVPPTPPDHLLTDLPRADARPTGGTFAADQSRVRLPADIPPMDVPATPAAKASRPGTVNVSHGGFLASLIRDAISDASASADVEYLPRLGAPWLEPPATARHLGHNISISVHASAFGFAGRSPSGHDARTLVERATNTLLTIGFGSIPGFPDKYRPVLSPEVQDYLHALDQVLRILRGEHVFPMLGGRKAGLIQGWTYVVDDEGNIYGSSLFHVDLVGASCWVKWSRILPSGAPIR